MSEAQHIPKGMSLFPGFKKTADIVERQTHPLLVCRQGTNVDLAATADIDS